MSPSITLSLWGGPNDGDRITMRRADIKDGVVLNLNYFNDPYDDTSHDRYRVEHVFVVDGAQIARARWQP
jgi:hypothetical protein